MSTIIDPKQHKKELLQELCTQGKTYVEIGKVFNVSRQRAKQLVDGFKLERPGVVRRRLKAEAVSEKKVAKWGDGNLEAARLDDLYKQKMRKFRAKKSNASRSGIEWDLKFTEVVFPEHCPMLGIPLDYFSDKICDHSPSFDRLDPNKGYTRGNTVVCSFRANRIKTDRSSDDLYKVYKYLTKLGF